jgi:16S rRNA (cytidine1402-2'-O)-methyltransferase
MTATVRGTLVLVPNALDLGAVAPVDLNAALPLAVIQRAARLTHWVVEDAKTARSFLRRVAAVAPLGRALQAIEIRELPRPSKGRLVADTSAMDELMQPALAGVDLGLLSEAGLPAVADPGAALVQVAHRLGVRVEPLPGPSALVLALAASGLNGQCFAFVGYLPVKAEARGARIRELDLLSRRSGQTQIAIETPYRNSSLLAALVEQLQPDTWLSVACALTLPEGWCRTQRVRDWRRSAAASINDRLPAVYLWLGA